MTIFFYCQYLRLHSSHNYNNNHLNLPISLGNVYNVKKNRELVITAIIEIINNIVLLLVVPSEVRLGIFTRERYGKYNYPRFFISALKHNWLDIIFSLNTYYNYIFFVL